MPDNNRDWYYRAKERAEQEHGFNPKEFLKELLALITIIILIVYKRTYLDELLVAEYGYWGTIAFWMLFMIALFLILNGIVKLRKKKAEKEVIEQDAP